MLIMSSNLQRQVLSSFKALHRTRNKVFKGDIVALNAAREKINEEFKKNKHVKDTTAIEELIKYSNEVEKELRMTVIQAKEIEPGKYQAEIKPETVKLDNVPFKMCEKDK